MKRLIVTAITALCATVVLSSCSSPTTPPAPPTPSGPRATSAQPVTVTEEEINAAQQAWCDALVEIGRRYEAGEDYRAFAEQVLTDAYDYDDGQVFFKPTLTWGDQTFRKTKAGALAYFVGGDENFPNDKGFALKPWVAVRYDNGSRGAEGVQIHGNIGITMGNVYLTDKAGNEIFVDKTFVFRKTDDGKVRLIVHNSSLPYNP
ncbi:MAG: hypothetical protein MUF48_20790 [Pirellulaceae bacterium]|jgi:hypothetical protein|nr:hypothetical protein [Pirellulaceae bacterium]